MKKIKFNNSSKLNSNLLAVLCGRSGAGKTYLLFKMLTTPGILDFNNLIIYTSTPEQPIYQFLKYGFLNNLKKHIIQRLFYLYDETDEELDIEEMVTTALDNPDSVSDENITITLTDNPNEIKSPTELRSKKNLIIFDDIVTKKDQSLPQEMFTKGRHNNCNCVYLTQSFHGLDGQFIRKNANVFILFEINNRNLSEVLKDISVGDNKDFKDTAKRMWNINHGYVVINLEKPLNERYFTDLF